MEKSPELNRQKFQQSNDQQKITRYLQFGLIGAGALLIIMSSVLLIYGDEIFQPGIGYRTADIVYDTPYHAIHEMDGARLNEIPFLPAGGPQPVIDASEAFFDLGVIGPSDIVTYEFAIFNRGEAPLTISRAFTTCGCTTADFTATVIPPGKVSIMTLTLDAGFHDVAGQTVRRGVIIENNDPNSPEFEIWVQADVSLE